MKPNLDRLHAVVTEARQRKAEGYTGKDIWKEDLKPDAAVRAKIVPLLEDERDRLKAQLEEVSSGVQIRDTTANRPVFLRVQLDQRNRQLQAQMQANVRARDEADEECGRLLDVLQEVRALSCQASEGTHDSAG